MVKKLAEKMKAEKQVYNFEQTSGIAGICPDCNSFIHFNSYHQRYECSGNDCAFIADINCERIWDNKMREENLKRLQKESDYKIKNGLDLY